MNPVLRRTLTFLVMVAAGLATILLLAEDSGSPVRPATRLEQRGDGRGLRVRDREENTREELELGDVEFSVTGEVELPDGTLAERPLYRIRIERGSPDAEGFYVVDRPVITFLDELTGEPRGQLTAVQGRFDTGAGGLGDGFGLDPGQLGAEALSLEGEVRGELPLDDGSVARLAAERLDIDRRRETVHGPGLVTWSRGDLTLSGHELHWDGAARLLTYESRAELTLRDPATAALTTLRAAGGLSWELPTGARGHGELHGPVTGSDEQGRSLRADRLLADADAGLLRLLGDAELRAGQPEGGAARFAAEELRVRRLPDGGLQLEEAVGRVRGARFDAAGGVSTFETERLVREGALLRGPGRARWTHRGLEAEGRELVWDEASGELRLLADVELVGGHDAPPSWRGARLSSPRGLTLSDGRVSLHGPLTGALPDGSRLGAERLEGDDGEQTLALLGDAWLERPAEAGGSDRFEGGSLRLWRAPDGTWSRLLARDAVRLLVERPGDPPFELLTDELERTGARVLLPGAFEARQGELLLAGRGLRLDEDARRADVLAEAALRTAGDEARGPAELLAPAGLTWWFGPEGAAVADGHGELRGPVEGHDARGGRLQAQLARVEGAAREVQLLGEARVEESPDRWVAGAELRVVEGADGLRRVLAPGAFALRRDTLSAEGVGLDWDESRGALDVRRHARLARALPEGGELQLACAGALAWTAPPGAVDALLEGRGRLEGDVRGSHPAWGRFSGSVLLLDGPAGTLELLGPCRLERDDGSALRAGGALLLERAPDGGLARLEASGGVEAERPAAGAVLRLAADSLARDELARRTVLSGRVQLERDEAGETTRLVTEPGGRVVFEQRDDGALSGAHAEGRVQLLRGELRATSDRLAWDVDADHLVLEGNCRFLAMGAWMSMERVEIWPRQMRWFIPRAEMEFPPRDDG